MRRKFVENVLLVCALATTGIATRLETSVDSLGSALFIKPTSTAAADTRPDELRAAFVPLLRPSSLTQVRAVFGDRSATESVPRPVLRKALGGSERQHPSVAPAGSEVEISAHVVAQAISSDRPVVQVLFHAAALPSGFSTIPPAAGPPSAAAATSTSGTGVGGAAGGGSNSEPRFCVTAHVHGDSPERRLSSTPCVLTARSVVCLAGVAVPTSWWNAERSENVQVLFSVRQLPLQSPPASSNSSSVGGGSQAATVVCSETLRNETTSSGDSTDVDSRNFLATLSLAHSQLTYGELKEDRNVLVYVPQGSFYPGSRFRVPVKLQVESDLRLFVVKVKARHGVRIVGAEARNSSAWTISLDLSHKLHGAMVTAAATDAHISRPTDRVEDVFEWIFEVDEDAVGDDRGRIQIIVEYEMNAGASPPAHQQPQHHRTASSSSRESAIYRMVENRITAHVDIQRDNTYAIVPVVKSTELVNTALLTGKMLTHAMRVYSVSHGGRLSDVTSQTTCHSGDEEALKVVESCSWVYMDGSETHGSSSVTVITKYGRHTRFTFFEVWAPQIPVEVVLSDSVLGQVKGWKTSGRQATPVLATAAGSASSRKIRGTDFGLLTQPGLLLQEDGNGRKDEPAAAAVCEARYQLAVVEVYASFSVADTAHSRYLVHQGVMFRVTDLVRAELRVADPAVAAFIDGNTAVEGLHPGRTEVQVLSRSGRVVGASELTVVAERIGIERLQVDIVAGLEMSIAAADSERPRTLVAMVSQTSQLTRPYQEALLSVSVQFDDGTTAPLHYFPPSDYALTVDTLNDHVVAFGEPFSPDSPRIVAVGAGKGELLKVSLELAEPCQRKKPRPLAVTYANVDVDFARPGDVQSDAAVAIAVTDTFGRIRGDNKSDRKAALHLSLDGDRRKPGLAVLSETSEKVSAAQRKEVQQNARGVGSSTQMSVLEISMYTLLGVFCVAVVVFSVNCAVFVARYRQRKKSVRGGGGIGVDLEDKDDPENCAPDWVWIGRETLERNAINTACSEALMPAADFNGNHTPGGSQVIPVADGGRSSAGSSGGVASSSAAVPTSNRNSFVSAYKGSECSILISGNPPSAVPDCNANVIAEANPALSRVNRGVQTLPRSSRRSESRAVQSGHGGGSLTRPSGTSRVRPPMIDKQLSTESSLDDDDDDDDMSSIDSPRHHRRTPHRHHCASAGGKMSRAETLRRLEEAVASGSSDIEWDCNELGVTYDQLMTYFDNLKESTA